MKMESIGFYTLEDSRAENVSLSTPLWRCELILTDTCNFKCPYCRGIEEEHCGMMSWDDASFVVKMWGAHNLRNIRFSGGEPTLWKAKEVTAEGVTIHRNLIDLVKLAKEEGVRRIAISTNGSVDTKFYLKLAEAGVTDFSISLDACCAETGDKMAGDKKGAWQKVVDNIKTLSALTYVTVGVVFTEENVQEFKDIVKFASEELGVSDIRILSAAQWNEKFKDVRIDQEYLDKHPILKYRMANFNAGRHVRGLTVTDSAKCPLMLDDMAILNGYHYPCIIYLREQGLPVGKMDTTVSPEVAVAKIRAERLAWVQANDVRKNHICAKNCLDVCIDYNNRVKELNPTAMKLCETADAKAKLAAIPIQRQ